jgi:hypothetical protein
MEYKQADLARAYGIPESTISRAIGRGDLVKNSGGRIDDENPKNKAYLSERHQKGNRDAEPDSSGKPVSKPPATVALIEARPTDLESRLEVYKQMRSMTIQEAIALYGSAEAMRDFVGALRDISAAEEKDTKTREKRLELVEKDFVTSHVYQFLDNLMKQLLEFPESSVDGIIALVLSRGQDARLEVSQKMEAGLTKIISGAKEHITKALLGLKAKYQKDDEDEIKERLEAIETKLEA